MYEQFDPDKQDNPVELFENGITKFSGRPCLEIKTKPENTKG